MFLQFDAGAETSSDGAGGTDEVAAASNPVVSTVPAYTKEQVCLLLWSLVGFFVAMAAVNLTFLYLYCFYFAILICCH